MTKVLQEDFEKRLAQTVELIDGYGISYEELGIFGSFARGTFTNRSDLDICLIVEEHPKRSVSGAMREDAEELGADVVYVTREYFEHSDAWFAQNLRRDYRRVK